MEKYKICPTCGKKNPPYKTECECETDLIGVRLTNGGEETKNQSFTLSAINDGFSFEVNKPFHILGRDNEMSEYFFSKTYVSGAHARLSNSGGELSISDLGSTNSTFVNDAKIQKNIPVKLKSGDVISLGGRKINGVFQEKAAFFVVGGGPDAS